MPILDGDKKASAFKRNEHTWSELASETWARPETKEIVAVSAAVGAMALGLRFGGNRLAMIEAGKGVSGLVERNLVDTAKAIGKEASSLIEHPPTSLTAAEAVVAKSQQLLAAGERQVPTLKEIREALSPAEIVTPKHADIPPSVIHGSKEAQEVLTEAIPAKPALIRNNESAITSVMDNPENVIRLTDRLKADTAAWPDIAPLVRRSDQAADKLEAAVERVKNRLSAKGINLDPLEMSDEQLTHLKQMPGFESTTRDLQSFMSWRNKSNSTYGEFRDERDKAAKLWTGSINKFSRSNGLPSAKLEFNNDPDNLGSYGNRLIGIDQELFIQRPKHIQAVQTGIHEYTHHEQEFLEFCRWADRMNLGRTASQDELGALSYFMHERVSDKNILRYLNIRNGRNLSANAEMRAESLIDSQISFRSITPRSEIREHNKTYDMLFKQPTKDIIRSLYGSDGNKLAGQIAADSADSPLAKRILTEFAPANARIDKPWSDAYTRKVRASLDDYIQRGRLLIDEKERIYNHAYASSFHEREAFDNGRIALEHLLQR